MHCRLILDDARDGPTNMAADEWLLNWAGQSGGSALRFYSWNFPTLSLGYFQKHDDRIEHEESSSCKIVRRASGGGAILHHHELTYSYVTPIVDRLHSSTDDIYTAFHQTLIESLAAFGVSARLADRTDVETANSASFLCFQRRSIGDVVLGNVKICGSAQRRHAHCLLQHGSVLLKRSEFAPQLAGIDGLGSATLSGRSLHQAWLPRIGALLQHDFDSDSPFSSTECKQIDEIAKARFANDQWLLRR